MNIIATTICSIIGIITISIFLNIELSETGSTDFVISVLSTLVTILIGWNIYTIIDVKSSIEKSEERIRSLEKELEEQDARFNSNIEELNEIQKSIQHYGYAITDFIQVYVKLKTDDADFYETYSKSLSALKNFLKTNEKMEWYAEACLKNCEEALNRAEESEKSLEEETKNNIAHHINKIRVCGKKEFEKYWDKILELEKRREKTPPIQLL